MKSTSKRALLFFPNTGNEGVMPLAIGILSSLAKRAGYTVDYLESTFYLKPDTAAEERERVGEFKPCDRRDRIAFKPYADLPKDLEERLRTFRPDIFAVSANSLEYELFCELIKDIRFPESKPFVIVGGAHASADPEEVISLPCVDAVCVGEGEGAWEEFLDRFGRREDLASIRNLWIKEGGKITRNPLRPLLTDEELWSVPIDYDLFDQRHFLRPFDGKIYHRGTIEVSRGCPYSCSYCVNSAFKEMSRGLGKFFRVRPFENLQEGIRKQAELGCQMLQLQDECFLSVSREELKRFCEWYGKEIRIPLMVQSRPETVTDEKIALLADMQIPVQVTCGIESGCPRILKEICNRNTTLDQIRRAYQIIRRHGLRSTAYTMIGFPTETREEAFQTIHLIRELPVDISIMSVFFPFKGVPLRQYCLEKGYITGKEKARTFTDPSILQNQPMSSQEIYALRRTYGLYTRLPLEYFPQIELCERDYEHHLPLFQSLVALANEKYYRVWKI